MKNILVPTDFSEVAKNALKFAIKIAHPLRARIILFHTEAPLLITSDMGGYIYAEAETEKNKEIHEQMNDWVDFVKSHNVYVDKLIHKGILKDTIADIIEHEEISLVVTGTHGAKGIEAFFFGTNSVDIIEKVKCPVLVVPTSAHYHGIKKIMYATDLQYGDIHELAKIAEIAKPFNAEIIVMHISSDSEKMVEEKENLDWFAEIGDSNIAYKNITYKLVYDDDVVEALDNAITVLDIDILCMSTVEKDFFKKITSKLSVRSMAFHTNIPMMALHLEKENKLH
ncbi:MAG TPA: universal stress protein [Cytophagaceae bacterium]|nr:universal stress protein [Cytophagaceae bacterium]